MGALDGPAVWPADPEHREAIDTLLGMAEAEHRWGDPARALNLLAGAERILGGLPESYGHLRGRCQSAVSRP